MSYRTIWELIKINILYSNPQALTTVQKKREKNPNKQIAAYKTVLTALKSPLKYSFEGAFLFLKDAGLFGYDLLLRAFKVYRYGIIGRQYLHFVAG